MVKGKVKLKKNRYRLHSLSPVLPHTPFFSLSVNFATSFFLTSILHSDSPQGARVFGLQISLQAIRREQKIFHTQQGLHNMVCKKYFSANGMISGKFNTTEYSYWLNLSISCTSTVFILSSYFTGYLIRQLSMSKSFGSCK